VEYVGETLGNVSGGTARGAVYEGLLKAAVELDFEKAFPWPGALFHVSGLLPHGASPSERLLGDLFTLSNIDASDSARLFELWLEQALFSDKVSLRIGQLAADEEFAGTEYGALFINGTCGWPAIIALNTPSPAYPLGSPGARLAWDVNDHWRFQTAAFAGNPDPVDAEGRSRNPNGTRFGLDGGAFMITEVMSQWNNDKNASGWPGLCRLGAWYHTESFDHMRLDHAGLSLALPASSGTAKRLTGNWGAYLTAEQVVYREAAEDVQGLGLFCRLGFSPEDRNLIGHYIEGGFNYRGLFPGRNEDEFGLAVVHGRISSDVRQLAREMAIQSTTEPLPDYEMIIETEYRLQVCPGWALQPGLHWILHPGGSAATPDALVLSLRTTFFF
jgi:porin